MKIYEKHPLYIIEEAIMGEVSEDEIDEYIRELKEEEELEGDQHYPISRDFARALVNLSRINTAWHFERENLERMLKVKLVK